MVRWAAVAGALAVMEVFLAFGRRYLLTLIATGLETQLRDDLYAQLQRSTSGSTTAGSRASSCPGR